MKYDYGDPKRGHSFEYETFYKSLVDSGYEVILFDFYTIFEKHGKKKMNEMFLETITKESPDIIFSVLYRDEFELETLKKIKETHGKSLVWMCDDKWRFDDLGSKVCHGFNLTVTTDPDAIVKYESLDYKDAVVAQWACMPSIHKNLGLKKEINVSFIGQANAWRKFVIKTLRKKGIRVECFGYGWENGRISQQEMIEIFNKSRINLNLSNSVNFNLKYALNLNLEYDRNKSLKSNIGNIFGSQLNLLLSKKRSEDMKARFFEVTGCGGFLLTYNVDHLDEYFELEKEIICFKNLKDLTNKIQYFLAHDKEREVIAKAGYDRTQKDHTYAKRFEILFKRLI
jgi:spore maturation protein CgeB